MTQVKFDFLSMPEQKSPKMHASGKKGMLSCCLCCCIFGYIGTNLVPIAKCQKCAFAKTFRVSIGEATNVFAKRAANEGLE